MSNPKESIGEAVRQAVRKFFQRTDPDGKGIVSEERFRAFLRSTDAFVCLAVLCYALLWLAMVCYGLLCLAVLCCFSGAGVPSCSILFANY